METEEWILVFQFAFAAIGFVVNIYIVAICCMDLSKGRSLSPRDKLIISLCFINLGLQIVMPSNFVSSYFWPQFYLDYNAKLFIVTAFFLISSSLWISTWLSVYRSIKMTNSQQKIVKWIRQQIPKKVPLLIIGSVTVSMAQTFSGINDLTINHQTVPDYGNNVTKVIVEVKSKCACMLWIYLTTSSLAFGLFFIATVSLLHSLWGHVNNMQTNGNIAKTPNLDKLYKACKTLTSLLLLCIAFYITQGLLFTNAFIYNSAPFIICMLFVSTFPSLNAVILIMGNHNLMHPITDILRRGFV